MATITLLRLSLTQTPSRVKPCEQRVFLHKTHLVSARSKHVPHDLYQNYRSGLDANRVSRERAWRPWPETIRHLCVLCTAGAGTQRGCMQSKLTFKLPLIYKHMPNTQNKLASQANIYTQQNTHPIVSVSLCLLFAKHVAVCLEDIGLMTSYDNNDQNILSFVQSSVALQLKIDLYYFD